MSWISKLLFGPDAGAGSVALANGRPIGTAYISPWQDSSSLAHIAYSELYAGATDIVDRNVAMRVAPIKRGRAIIVGSIADLPLSQGAFDPAGEWVPSPEQPAWLTESHNPQTVWHRMAHTIDDLIFSGWSLWALNRDQSGTITDALRVNPLRWSFDQNTPLGLKIDGQPVTDRLSVALIQGPDEGILATGADIVRGARAMEAAWVGRVQNPIPMVVLHEAADNGVTDAEAQQYVDAWAAARTSPTGAIGFLPASLNLEVYGDTEADLFTEGRNNVRLDVANLLNLPASSLDGSTASASLTYVTQEGDRTALVDWLEYWMAPVDARLSQDDITPAGQVIRFNRSNLTNAPNDDQGATTTAAPAPALEVAP